MTNRMITIDNVGHFRLLDLDRHDDQAPTELTYAFAMCGVAMTTGQAAR
jgi:hypothetical protein